MDYIVKHLEKYPLMQEQDLVKLIHQRVFGPGPLIFNLDRAMDYITFEFQEAHENECVETEKFTEISSDTVRVNLGVYDEAPDWLIDALISTANSFEPNPEDFLKLINGTKSYIVSKDLDFSLEKIDLLVEKIVRTDYQPIHHSQRYREAYYPHYRVVKKDFIK